MVGIIEIEGENAIGIILSPCIIMALIGFCCNHFCCTYNNADIIMSDNSLIIKRRSCVWQSTKIYYPGQIHEMELYMYDRENRKQNDGSGRVHRRETEGNDHGGRVYDPGGGAEGCPISPGTGGAGRPDG